MQNETGLVVSRLAWLLQPNIVEVDYEVPAMLSTQRQSKSSTTLAVVLLLLATTYALHLKSNFDVDCQLSRIEQLTVSNERARKSIRDIIVTASAPYSSVEILLRGQDSVFVELNILQGDKNKRLQKVIDKAITEGISPIWCPDCRPKIFGFVIPSDFSITLWGLLLAFVGVFVTPKIAFFLKNRSQ
jgi:hypothetical protein